MLNNQPKTRLRKLVGRHERSEARHNNFHSVITSNSIDSNIQGFTLLELIIVIIILGVMSVGISGFISLTTQTYLNVSERDELLSSARFAVERLNREVRNSVPNSVRVTNDSTRQCLEFVPIVASTTYIDIPVPPDLATDVLSVVPFQGEDSNDYQCPGFCLDAVTVYPLDSTDIYANQFDGVGKVFGLKTVTQITANEWNLTMDRSSGVLFDDDSPTQRLYVIRRPVSYCVKDNTIVRYDNYGYAVNQSLNPIAPKVLMAENIATINQSDLPFTLLPATLQRNSMLQVNIHFQRTGEDIVFNNDIHIHNTP